MNTIQWFLTGLGSAGVAGIPLIAWAQHMGKEVYANSRIRGKSSKLFSEEEIGNLQDPRMLSKLQRSRYWQRLQFAGSRQEYEKSLELIFRDELRSVLSLSSASVRPFLEGYYQLREELHDLKLITWCVENSRDAVELSGLLASEKYIDLLKADSMNDIFSRVKGIPDFDYVTYSRHGLTGLEYTLDVFFFRNLKKMAATGSLKKLFSIIRKNYLLNNITRLKGLGHKESAIIEILRLKSKREIALVKKDLNIILKEFSEKDKAVRSMVLEGRDSYEILDSYFSRRLLDFTSREKLKSPFSNIASFNLLERIKREVSVSKTLWGIR